MSAETITASAPALPEADPGRHQWLTRMIFMSRPGPMDQAARDAVAAEAAAIIASGTCPDPFGHRLHVIYLSERCPDCGGHEPLRRESGVAV